MNSRKNPKIYLKLLFGLTGLALASYGWVTALGQKSIKLPFSGNNANLALKNQNQKDEFCPAEETNTQQKNRERAKLFISCGGFLE